MGNFKLAFFLAYKSIIKGNRWTLALIILVMSLSFANLILVPSLLSGVTKTLNNQQINYLFANILIDPPADKYYLDNTELIMKKTEQISGVVGVSSHLVSSAFFEYQWEDKLSQSDKGNSGTWNVIGIDPLKEAEVTGISSTLLAGSYLNPEDRDKILLGIEIAGGDKSQNISSLTLGGAKIGDKIRLTYVNGIQREYTIKGIFQTKYAGGADSLAFVSRKEMVSVLGQSEYLKRSNQILVSISNDTSQQTVIDQINGLGIKGVVRSWKDYGGWLGGMVSSFDVIASLIGAIGLFVAGIVMFIVIYINVVNKKRQIGILRAIGVNKSVIFFSYLIQSLLFAVLGVVIGGLLFGYGIKQYYDYYPIDLQIGLVRLTVDMLNVRNASLGIIFAAILAGIIPVFNITRHSIIKAIWGN